MSNILQEGLAAAAVEFQSGFSPRPGLIRDLCDTIDRLTAELAEENRVKANLQDLVRQCRKRMRQLDSCGHIEQTWPDFCADTERLIEAAVRMEGER